MARPLQNTDWVVKHGCRTLLKQGHPEAMQLFDFTSPDHIVVDNVQHADNATMGKTFTFLFELTSQGNQPLGKLRLEFAIDFMKANGKLSRKVFHISEGQWDSAKKQVTKTFSFKPITTRNYYTGEHGLSILVNGIEKTRSTFTLDS